MVNWFRSLFPQKRANVVTFDTSDVMTFPGATSSGVYVTDAVAMTVSAVFRSVAIISQSMAGLPVSVVQIQGKKLRVIDNHPLNLLLNLEFNRSEDSVLGRERVQTGALLGRAGYAEILRPVSGPVQLMPIHPDRITPTWVKDTEGQWVRFFNVDHGSAYIPDRNIVQISGFGFNGLDGLSIISQAAESIGHAKSLEQYGAGNFNAGTTPRGVLKTQRVLTAEEKSRMRVSWETVHTKPNSIAILDEDYTFTPIDINNEDRQFLQSRSFQVVEVARWFGIPPHMLAELKDANYATASALGDEFKSLTLQPWVNRWERELTRKLLSPAEIQSGHRVILDMDGMLRPDFMTRMNGHRTAISIGLKTINECRVEEELPPSTDPRCDMHLIQLNMAGADGTTETQPVDAEAGATE